MNPIPGGSKEKNIIILSKRTLFDVMLSPSSHKFEDRCEHLLAHVSNVINCPLEALHIIMHKLSHFTSDFKSKWNAAKSNKTRFLTQNQKWLDNNITFPLYANPIPSTSGGQPSVDFLESSERSKRRKTEKLRSQASASQLVYAAQMSLREKGEVDAATVVKEIKFSTPKRAHNYRKAYKMSESKLIPLSGDQALSILIEAQLTRQQYEVIRVADKQRFPSYKKIQEAKKHCYPEETAITVTKRNPAVGLQALLDHTVKRIVKVQEEVLQTLSKEQRSSLMLLSKWGCDGSSGQSLYKQKFDDEEDSDASIFLTSFVPLQLIASEPNSSSKIIVWQNSRPSSPRYCRSIRLQFLHETADITMQEKDYIETQINQLVPTSARLEETEMFIRHTLQVTMIDGKVCNAASSTTSTQKCYMCGATSKTFNNIDLMLKQKVDSSTFRFGLSSLHAWIRFFGCLLHVAYKLPIKKWQARREDNKTIVAETKKKIQADFKSKLGLIVDRPKPGFGSSNDGNTARRFFKNTELSSTLTGIDVEVIQRFKVILQSISSGYSINITMFENYALTTARLFAEKYSWYSMPTTVHKILIHSPAVIEFAILPIGQLSEEAQEALNKHIKKYRAGYSRKCSREKTLEDVFNRLLICSDPYISSLRKLPRKKAKPFDKDVLALLLPAEAGLSTARKEDSNSEKDSSSDSDED